MHIKPTLFRRNARFTGTWVADNHQLISPFAIFHFHDDQKQRVAQIMNFLGIKKVNQKNTSVSFQPKNRGKNTPNHPMVNRVFHEIFTIHFGGFTTIFGNTHIISLFFCSALFEAITRVVSCCYFCWHSYP